MDSKEVQTSNLKEIQKDSKPKRKVHKTTIKNKLQTPEKTASEKSVNMKRKAEEMDVEESNSEGVPVAPVFPADKACKLVHHEERNIIIPRHRLNPLKLNWIKIQSPIVEYLKLNVRFNLRTKQVQIRTSAETEDTSNIQKAADFIQAFVYGFEVDDALALIRLHDLYLETFDIKDVKHTLAGDHVGRAIGRIAGKNGKTRFTLENATKTRIIVADSRIHILGAFQNIAVVRRAICNLILGSPPSKVFGNLKAFSDKICERV